MKNLFLKYKEPVLYIVFGTLTTLVNLISFKVLNVSIGEDYFLINNVIAWLISVVFAYITNKIFVFKSKNLSPIMLLKEISLFAFARVFSLVVEEAGLWLLVEKLGFDKYSLSAFDFTIDGKMLAKIILAVVVIILNYFFSKFIIFTKKPKEN